MDQGGNCFGIIPAVLIWLKSLLGLIVIPFIFDAYITKRIHWTFWKKWKNQSARIVMGWIDAIVFSLLAVYFVHNFLAQNYQIPSSSLEKSLLVGDFLCVSKVSYGPRIPMTPLSMPLTQHTMPVFNTKSYLDHPQWAHKRAKGLGNVKLNDIVVFNFPAGDTVALNVQQRDFYSLAMQEGKRLYSNKVEMDSLTAEQQELVLNKYYSSGRQLILSNPKAYGEVIARPVDRRENYVKRCVGLPGDTLTIVNNQVYIDNKALENPEELQLNYYVQTTGPLIAENIFRDLGISKDDQFIISEYAGWVEYLKTLGFNTTDANGKLTPTYLLPLTQKMYETLSNNKALVAKIAVEPSMDEPGEVYPLNKYTGWTRSDYGPIWIPSKGSTLALNADNLPLYERCIRTYEGNDLEVKDGTIFINGEKADSYTFKMDYYWLMGDNRHNSLDSRYWGFVPEDHVVGKPIMVWLSLDKDRGWFDGKIRWNRIFTWVR